MGTGGQKVVPASGMPAPKAGAGVGGRVGGGDRTEPDGNMVF